MNVTIAMSRIAFTAFTTFLPFPFQYKKYMMITIFPCQILLKKQFRHVKVKRRNKRNMNIQIRLPSSFDENKEVLERTERIRDHRYLYSCVASFNDYAGYYANDDIPYITPPTNRAIKKYLNLIQKLVNNLMKESDHDYGIIADIRELIKKKIKETSTIFAILLKKSVIDDGLYMDCKPIDISENTIFSWDDIEFKGMYLKHYDTYYYD
jgi:hypothetical protein